MKKSFFINWRQILVILVSVIALLSISEQLPTFSEAEFLVDSSIVESEASGDSDELYPQSLQTEPLLPHGRSTPDWIITRSVALYNPHFSPEARAGPLS